MAKRQKNHFVRASFHYLVKSVADDGDTDERVEEGFTDEEFQRVVNRIANTAPLDEDDPEVVASIKAGRNLPFNFHEEPSAGLHFGDFEGAYYGQQYRNNRLGLIDADSLNLRGFHYLITKLRNGHILVGTTYHGQFGDYEGLRSCLTYFLGSPVFVASKTLKSVSSEIGDGQAVSLNLTYRKARDRAERKPLFGSTGVIAIKSSDFGPEFGDRVAEAAQQLRGTEAQRRSALAALVNGQELLELNEDEIVGCSAIVRKNGRDVTP